MNIDLRRRETYTWCRIHRFEHIVEQTAHPIVHNRHGAGLCAQTGVGIFKNCKH
jgi:hypothetical protein